MESKTCMLIIDTPISRERDLASPLQRRYASFFFLDLVQSSCVLSCMRIHCVLILSTDVDIVIFV